MTRNRSLKRKLDLTENNNTYFIIYSVHFLGGMLVADSDDVICIYKYVTNFVNVSFIKL